MNVICLVGGHKYLRDAVEKSEDAAPQWTCKRCSHVRYTQPPDFGSGVDPSAGAGGGGFGGKVEAPIMPLIGWRRNRYPVQPLVRHRSLPAGSSSDLVAPAAPAAVIKAPAPAALIKANPFRVGAAVAA